MKIIFSTRVYEEYLLTSEWPTQRHTDL